MTIEQLKIKLEAYNTGNLPEGETARFLAYLHNEGMLDSFDPKFRKEFNIYYNRCDILLDRGTAFVNRLYREETEKPASITMKAEKVTAFYVDYNDLDEFLSAVFNVQYEIVAFEELGNDTAKTFNVEAKPLDEYYRKNLDQHGLHYMGSLHYMTGLLLDEACHRGLIEPGKYVVKISW